MNVRIKLFSSAREKTGTECVELVVSPEATLQELIGVFSEAYPELKRIPGRWAVNLHMAPLDQPLRPTDEIAFIPPVSGG